MQTRIGFLTGLAVGYVLGARAGRARYDQIKKQADTLWNDPRVQGPVSSATETVKAKAPEVQARLTQTVQEKAPVVGQKFADAASSAKDAVAEKAAHAQETVALKASDAKDTVAEKAAHAQDTVVLKTTEAKDAAAGKAAEAKAKVSGDHTGNQIGVEVGSDVEPHEVKFESAD